MTANLEEEDPIDAPTIEDNDIPAPDNAANEEPLLNLAAEDDASTGTGEIIQDEEATTPIEDENEIGLGVENDENVDNTPVRGGAEETLIGPTTRTRTSNDPDAIFYRLNDRNKPSIATQLKKRQTEDAFAPDDMIGACLIQAMTDRKKEGVCFNMLAMTKSLESLVDTEVVTCYNQESLNKGIREFGERAEEAVMKEFLQFKRQEVLRPRYSFALTLIARQEALRLIMTIKEKRNRVIKGRGCADGRGLRSRIAREDATSPTASTEAFAMTCTIDAKEERVVVTCDVPGAYLHCEMDEECYVLLEGGLVDLFVRVMPEAKDMVEIDNRGKKRLYTRMYKALEKTVLGKY